MSGPNSISFSTSVSETGRPIAGWSKGPGMSIAWKPPARSPSEGEPCAFADTHSAVPVDPLIAVADWLHFLQRAEDGAHANAGRAAALMHVERAIKALTSVVNVVVESRDPVPDEGTCGC